jgi:hypothetical protein
MLPCRSGLAKVGWARRGHFRIMIPNLGTDLVHCRAWPQESRQLCASSQMFRDYYGILKNLAFAVEPAANPIRPTLRDGH